MRAWQLLSTRNPLWPLAGLALLLGVVGTTGLFVARGPRPIKPTYGHSSFTGPGTRGRFGTVTEPLGKGLFVLSYETILGKDKDLQLQGVSGRLEEVLTTWKLTSPAARKQGDVWTLMGPMDLQAVDPGGSGVQGTGAIPDAAPALAWEHGVWRGLSPLIWDDLRGSGRGRWHLPSGWHRGLDGKFIVEKGPVHWQAAEPGTLKSLVAERMWAALGFREGHLEKVAAELEGGELKAEAMDIKPDWVLWPAALAFVRSDGWHGVAGQGRAPRPPEGHPFDRVEFQAFNARRTMEGGEETLHAEGTRWTPAGLRLEGGVVYEQPLDSGRIVLRAPRVLQRTAPGPDLPAALPIGETWAEPQAVLTWGAARSLSSPRIEVRQKQRHWRILAPAYGKAEMGTFSAGEGQGTPAKWQFAGPIQATLQDGAALRGDSLVWEGSLWTLDGRPCTLTRLRQRLSGPRLIRQDDDIQFPKGISGALAASDGDINLRADKGNARANGVLLEGRVECQGPGWSLQADRISVTLGPGKIVKQVTANGTVVLRGRMGEGRGDALDLDPVNQKADWRGRVKAVTEVRP